VASWLSQVLATPAQREREPAAAAASGLIERDAQLAAQLLQATIDDPSHDVRVAVLPSLASTWAKTNSVEQLAAAMRGAENDAMRRLIGMAAFVVLARTPAGRAAAETALAQLADTGPSLARIGARLTLGLITRNADGIRFLQQMVP
jgi:hypothetical protein